MDNLIYFDAGLKRWIRATAYKNYWRVSHWYDLEDLIQDGYMAYCTCAEHYGHLVRKRKPSAEDRRNFMALVKRTFENHIHDLATKRTVTQELPISMLQNDDDDESHHAWLEQHSSCDQSVAEITAMFNSIKPRRLRNELLTILDEVGKGKRLSIEQINERLRKAKGAINSVDILSELYNDLRVVRQRMQA